MHSSKYWNEEKQIYVCECRREFKKHQSLLAHFCYCLIHKEAIGVEVKVADSKHRCGDKCNFSKAFLGKDGIKEMHDKSRQTIEDNIQLGKHYTFNFDGRIKQGWYKGFYCDSSYELAFVIYCLDHNIPIQRCKQVFKYEYNGKIHRYYPDFEINGTIYEIKGQDNELSLLKQKLFPNIIVLHYDDLKKQFSYVIEKYGKHFWLLYEK